MDWFYSDGGQQKGPVSQEQLAELYRNGSVKGTDLVWCDSMTDWTAISKIPAFASVLPNSPSTYAAPATPEPSQRSPMDIPGLGSDSRPSPSSPSPYSTQSPYSNPTPQGVPSASMSMGAMPPNYLWQSILVTVLCCLPLGIPAIIFSTKVNTAFGLGQIAEAESASQKAKKWCLIALIVGIIVNLVISGIYVAVIAAGMSDALQNIQVPQ